MFESGVDAVIAGLAVGLVTSAYPPARDEPRARRPSSRARSASSRRPSSPRSAQLGVASAISPNERLQYRLHPWTSYVIVPLFALANAGIHVDGDLLSTRSPRRSHSGSSSATWSASRSASLAPPGSPRGDGARLTGQLAGAGRRGGDGRHRLHGVAAGRDARVRRRRARARRSSACSPRPCSRRCVAWVVVPCRPAAARRVRARQLAHTAETLLDLAEDVDPERDHIRGSDRGGGHAARVRRLRVPVLQPGRADRREMLARSATSCATSAATCRSPTCTPTPRWPPRPPRPRPRRARSGRCTTGCSPTRTSWPPTICAATRRRSASTSSASARSCAVATTPPGSPRTCQRRRQRRGRHADLLRQRTRHHGAYDVATLSEAVQRARRRERSRLVAAG